MRTKSHPRTYVKVKLLNETGNAFYILGAVSRHCGKPGMTKHSSRHFRSKPPPGITTIEDIGKIFFRRSQLNLMKQKDKKQTIQDEK